MKKCCTILICFILNGCYYTYPSQNYYDEIDYIQPDYYSQTTTYVTPASSYTYVSEQTTYVRPEVVYIDDTPRHHYSHSPRHEYHYPKDTHHYHKEPQNHHKDKKDKAQKPRPGRGGPEKITFLENDKGLPQGKKEPHHNKDKHKK